MKNKIGYIHENVNTKYTIETVVYFSKLNRFYYDIRRMEYLLSKKIILIRQEHAIQNGTSLFCKTSKKWLDARRNHKSSQLAATAFKKSIYNENIPKDP